MMMIVMRTMIMMVCVVLISESLPCSTSLYASLPAFMIRIISQQHRGLDSYKKQDSYTVKI